MTDTTTQPASKKTLAVYSYRTIAGDRTFKMRVGSAWLHSSGKGCKAKFDAFPLNGEIDIFFEPLENE